MFSWSTGTIISIAYDNVEASETPEEWRLAYVFIVSTLLGTVAVISSIWLLFLAIHSHTSGSFFDGLGFTLSIQEVVSMMYLKISLSDFLTVFAARLTFYSLAVACAIVYFISC